MGIDVQRGGGLAVAQEARHRGHVCAVCDEQAGVGVPQRVDVQILRQAMLFQNQLEPPGEGGGRHGKAVALAAEKEVTVLQFSAVIGFRLPYALLAVFSQQGFHLQREVDIAVSGDSFGSLGEDLLVRHLHCVPADMDGAMLPVDVAPLQGAALAPAHACGDHQLEVGLILDALVLQGGDDLSYGLRVRDFLLCLSSRVAVGAPGGVMTQKATLHGIGENAAQRSVHALNGVLGEWLFGFRADGFTELGVEGPEVLRPQLCELVVAQGRENADDVLLVSADGGLGQLAGGDLPQPQIDVGSQGDGLWGFLRGIPAGSLEEHRLLLEPFLPLLWRQSFGRMNGFLPGFDARAFIVVPHGDHDEIAVSPFSDTCHMVLTSLSLASFQLRPVWQTQHTESNR